MIKQVKSSREPPAFHSCDDAFRAVEAACQEHGHKIAECAVGVEISAGAEASCLHGCGKAQVFVVQDVDVADCEQELDAFFSKL